MDEFNVSWLHSGILWPEQKKKKETDQLDTLFQVGMGGKKMIAHHNFTNKIIYQSINLS